MRKLRAIFSIFSLLITSFAFAAPDLDAGKELFKNNCASCHNKNMKDNLTGPALAGYANVWSAYPKEDLYKWIRNSQSLITAGHPRATELWSKWKPTQMTAFPSLSDADIENILAYVDGVLDGSYGPKPVADAGAAGGQAAKSSGITKWFPYIIACILGLFAIILFRTVDNLEYIKRASEGDNTAIRSSLYDFFTSKTAISLLLFAGILFGGYTTLNNGMALGRQQNYAPEQPIKFSHATHAGLNKIDCNYCHDGARRSKHSIIPGASTCMNCHAAIKTGSKYGTAEITKIYASIGFNPATGTYIPNYENFPSDSISAVYKDWIGKQYMATNKLTELNPSAQQFVDDQWNDIVNSLTHENKKQVQGPIEWIRIHNLPDHVYFNHAQHVTVGKVDCKQCHGKIEEMDVVKQYSPLSMAWCINCHRQTDVKFADNAYYNSFKTYHDELKKGSRTSVKVADIGGLECQKCHY